MPDDSNENGWVPQSRRQWMKYMAATGTAAGLAGCSGDGSETTEPETDIGGGGDNENIGTDSPTPEGGNGNGEDDSTPTPRPSYDGYWRLPAVFNLAQIDFNLWNPSANMFYPNRLVFEGFAEYSIGTSEWLPTGATDWTYEDNAVTIDLRDDMVWHSGQDVTAQHVADHFHLGKVRSWPPWSITNEINVTGKHQLEFDLKTGAKSFQLPAVLGTNWTHWFWTHPEHHGDLIERAKDATTEDEMQSVNGDLSEFSITPETAIEEGVGFGPFKPSSYANTELTLEPHEDYPWGLGRGDPEDYSPNYNGIQFEDFGESESDFHEAAIADNIDGFTGTTSRSVRQQMADHWVFRPNPNWGQGSIIFSPESMWGQDNEEARALRQAVAYFYDPQEWQAIRGENVTLLPDPNMATGLNTPQDNQYLDDILDDLTDYGSSDSQWKMPDKAAEKMEEAGYTKDGDWWTKNGEKLEVELSYNSEWTANTPAYKNIAEQFRAFGIDANANGMANTPLLNAMGEHDFEIALMNHGFGPHAFDSYNNSLGTQSANVPSGSVYTNELSEVTVPWPVGNPDGDLQTINIDDKLEEFASASEQSKVERLSEELGWVWNQWVPSVEHQTKVRLNYLATDTWNWDASIDSPPMNMEQPWVYTTRSGQLQGIPQN